MIVRKLGLILLNGVPLCLSLYIVARLYDGQLDLKIVSLDNVPYFLGLVGVCLAGYLNTIWRYIMALRHEGLEVNESEISERLMQINLISLFMPFGILNYAAQLALVYRGNPVRVVSRAFLHDKLIFMCVIASCFLVTFDGLTPALADRLGFYPPLPFLFMVATCLGVVGLVVYLIWQRYTVFLAVQLAIFGAINTSIAALLTLYTGASGVVLLWLYLQKLFAYSLAVVLPVSLGGVGPREVILLFDIDAPANRAMILEFCVMWFVALIIAALMLFVFRGTLSYWTAKLHCRWNSRHGLK